MKILTKEKKEVLKVVKTNREPNKKITTKRSYYNTLF